MLGCSLPVAGSGALPGRRLRSRSRDAASPSREVRDRVPVGPWRLDQRRQVLEPGSDRKTPQRPCGPSSPWPRLAWWSRLAPRGTLESLTWTHRSRLRPDLRVVLSRARRRARRGEPISKPAANRWQQSRQVPSRFPPPAASTSSASSSKFLPQRPLGPGRVLEQERAAVRPLERLADHLAGPLHRGPVRLPLARARVEHDPVARRSPSPTRSACCSEASDLRRISELLGRAVDQVDGVDDDGFDPRAVHRLAEGGEVLVAVGGRPPHPRALVKDLDRVGSRARRRARARWPARPLWKHGLRSAPEPSFPAARSHRRHPTDGLGATPDTRGLARIGH